MILSSTRSNVYAEVGVSSCEQWNSNRYARSLCLLIRQCVAAVSLKIFSKLSRCIESNSWPSQTSWSKIAEALHLLKPMPQHKLITSTSFLSSNPAQPNHEPKLNNVAVDEQKLRSPVLLTALYSVASSRIATHAHTLSALVRKKNVP